MHLSKNKEPNMKNTRHSRLSNVRHHRATTLLCMLFFLLSGVVFCAEEDARKVVRVAYQEFGKQMIVDEDNKPVSGYAYEFIETVGVYAGWKIEYIPCDNFADSIEKLLAGDVDLIYDINYTEERAKEMLFPEEPMGFEYYFLYASEENTSIVLGEIESLNGRTVGVTSGTALIDLLKQWCTKKNVDLKLVEYANIPEKEADLLAGKIDLDLEVSSLATNHLSTVAKVGSSPYYLVANKKRQDLIKDFNSAMERILNKDLYYFSRLQEQYFSDTVLSRSLTPEEKKWIANHDVLRIGFFDNYLPFSAMDKNGKPTGACIEAVREIIKKLQLEDTLKVEFICYKDQKAGYKAIESGEVDVMLPAYISNSVKHDYRIMGGKVLVTLTSDLAFLEDFGDGKGKRIAVNRHNLMQYYNSRDSYPNAEVVFYDSIQGCLDGILAGAADGTFLNGLRSEALLKPIKYHSLKKAQAQTDYIFYMAFAEGNLGLMLMMDRGLAMLDPAFINKKAYSYLVQMNTFTIMDYFREHILLLIIVVAILVAVVITLIGYQISIRKLETFNRELKERSETIEKQRQQESELRKQLEMNQVELKDALQKAQAANLEKTVVLADLEDASQLARLASFHYDFDTRIRTGVSSLLCELWPVDENGNALLEEEFVYPEDLPVFKQNMKALFEKKNEMKGTVQFSFRVGKDASDLRYYRMKLTLDPRKPNAVLGIVQDVTELALSMLKLKDTQALWDAAINAMPFMLTVKDVDNGFRYLLCNNAFADIFSCPPSEITGKTDSELFDNIANLDFANRMNNLALTMDVNEMKEFEEDLPVVGGGLRSIKTVMRIIRDTSGHKLLLTASSDVSEMVNAKRAAEENADRFLLTLRSIGDGIITTDARGVVTMLNPNAETLLGCKQSDVLGKSHTDFFRIVHEQTGKTVSSPLADALQSGEVTVGADMTDLISASGHRYHIAANAAPIHTRSGEITGAILVFRDVTDERNKREELRRAMISLENASGMARLAAFRYEIKTRRRSGSSILYSLWPNDENGNPIRFEDWVYPDDIPVFASELEKIEHSSKEGETVTFSFRVGSGSGLRYIRALVSLDLSNPDEPAEAGILQDVTELTLSMVKLKDTQALWNAAINSIPIMFTVKDMDDEFRYLLCNKAFANVFNFSPDEIVGKTDHDIFHDDTTLGFADQLNNPSTGTDGITEIEGELPDGSGRLRYIKTLMRVFRDARGHRLLLAAASDVTDMHSLIQNQKIINQLLEDIIGEEDFDQCIQRTLETVCKILGASRGFVTRIEEDKTLTRCVFEYVEPTHPRAEFKTLDRTFNRIGSLMTNTVDDRTFICSDVASIDWSTIKEDWHRIALAFDLRATFMSNIICNGTIWGVIGFNFEGVNHTFSDNDISLLHATTHMIEVVLARKRAKALIMDALAHAQAADKAKSFFIASVSHEIRTPLNSVIGFAELLREGGVSEDQAKEYLDAISSSANALLMLINDVLDLSKLEANQMQIITAFTDFNALCREVMLIFTFRAQENDNKLVSDVPGDLPELDVDNIRIRQILINLLGNAVKFTKKGTITLHVSFTPDPDSADTGTLRCAVSDTGIGISEEDQKKLMEPFVQLSRMRDTNAVKNGTGLGLSISKRLATCMNGELTCSSKAGEGSTFTLTLNAVRYRARIARTNEAQAGRETDAEVMVQGVNTIRILIVDDVPMNLRVAKALFNKIGFDHVFTAESGREALELLDKQPVDLILSDMWMPEMNGMQLSAEVKRDPRFEHIPIVAQTADVETSGNFDMSHFDAIILKPLTKEKLANMVKRIIVDGDLRKGDDGAPVNLG